MSFKVCFELKKNASKRLSAALKRKSVWFVKQRLVIQTRSIKALLHVQCYDSREKYFKCLENINFYTENVFPSEILKTLRFFGLTLSLPLKVPKNSEAVKYFERLAVHQLNYPTINRQAVYDLKVFAGLL